MRKVTINKILYKMKEVPFIDIAYIYITAGLRHNRIVKLNGMTFDLYSLQNGIRIDDILSNSFAKIYKPEFYTMCSAQTFYVKTPPIFMAKMDNVTALGGSNLCIYNDTCISDEYGIEDDGRIVYSSYPLRGRHNNKLYIETDKDIPLELDSAINLLGFGSTNYYHATIEILSRYRYFEKIDRDVPVLLDASFKEQGSLRQMMERIVQDRPIVYVPISKRIKCHYMYYVSKNTWMPMNVRSRYMYRVEDNLIHPSAIDNIRRYTAGYMLPQSAKKIFITRRNQNNRRLFNEEAVIEQFAAHGYDIVSPEDWDFISQVGLFSRAICIVGASGAALTNLLYCHRGTVFGCFIPQEYDFYIYSSIGNQIGCKTLFFDCDIYIRDKYSSRDKIVADISRIPGYIEQLDELINTR